MSNLNVIVKMWQGHRLHQIMPLIDDSGGKLPHRCRRLIPQIERLFPKMHLFLVIKKHIIFLFDVPAVLILSFNKNRNVAMIFILSTILILLKTIIQHISGVVYIWMYSVGYPLSCVGLWILLFVNAAHWLRWRRQLNKLTRSGYCSSGASISDIDPIHTLLITHRIPTFALVLVYLLKTLFPKIWYSHVSPLSTICPEKGEMQQVV